MVKNVILKVVTAIALIVFMLSVIALDSDSYIPFFTGMGSGLWLLGFAIANKNTLKA